MVKKAVTLNTPTGFPPGMPAGLPFSPGMRAGDFIFTSGQVGGIDDNGAEVKGIEAQTRQTMENIRKILEAAGSSFRDVVKVTIFLVDVNDFAKMNDVYRTYFSEDLPARSTVVVAALARPAWLVEIECIAYRP